MATESLTSDEMGALNNLMEYLNIAEGEVVDNIRRSPRLADKERVDYRKLNSRGFEGGKRKRKMRGGGVCTDPGPKKWAYNLAIDSVLVMAGAAGITTGVFGGWTVLSAFITTFGLGDLFLTIIKAVYDILRVISIHLVFNITPAAWVALKTTTTFSAGFAYDSIVEIFKNSDALIDTALVRYVLTENNAIADIGVILATLNEKYARLNDRVGVWTRSGQEKMVALQGQIDRLTAMAAAQAARASAAAQSATNTYGNIKQAICNAIDRGIDDVCATSELINIIMQMYGFRGVQANGGCTISGGRRRRKSKRSTRRGKRSTKRTKKNSRRSSRRK